MAHTPDKSILYLGSMEIEELSGGAVVGTRYYDNIAVRTATGLVWVINDRNNTSTIQIDADTLQAEQRRLLPYGEPHGTQPTWVGSKGYVGGTSDTTGLTHLGAREYDPTLGRFISPDPIVNITDTQQMQGYNYGNHNPATWSDPEGLIPSHGSVDAHETAVYLRWLDLVEAYGLGVRITVSPRTQRGADIVCWNCDHLASGGESDDVWVWEVKPDQESSSSAVRRAKISLNNGIEWAKKQEEAQGREVMAGPEFDHASSAQNVRRPNETVVVESRGQGVELYRVYKNNQRPTGYQKLVRWSAAEMALARLLARLHRDGVRSVMHAILELAKDLGLTVLTLTAPALKPKPHVRKPPPKVRQGGTTHKPPPPPPPRRPRIQGLKSGLALMGGGRGLWAFR
jgi:RHS repeat-associated protein